MSYFCIVSLNNNNNNNNNKTLQDSLNESYLEF